MKFITRQLSKATTTKTRKEKKKKTSLLLSCPKANLLLLYENGMNWQIRKMSVSSILLSISCDDMTDNIGAQVIAQPYSSTRRHVCPIDT